MESRISENLEDRRALKALVRCSVMNIADGRKPPKKNFSPSITLRLQGNSLPVLSPQGPAGIPAIATRVAAAGMPAGNCRSVCELEADEAEISRVSLFLFASMSFWPSTESFCHSST